MPHSTINPSLTPSPSASPSPPATPTTPSPTPLPQLLGSFKPISPRKRLLLTRTNTIAHPPGYGHGHSRSKSLTMATTTSTIKTPPNGRVPRAPRDPILMIRSASLPTPSFTTTPPTPTTPPPSTPRQFLFQAAKPRSPPPSLVYEPYATSSPSTPRSRSPSVSSLETIPDTPEEEVLAEEAVIAAAAAAAVAEEREGEERGINRGANRGGEAIRAREKRKRWSVCGAEKRADLELETIWEEALAGTGREDS